MLNLANFPYLGSLKIEATPKAYHDEYPVKFVKNGQTLSTGESVSLQEGEELFVAFREEFVGDVYFVCNGHARLQVIYGECEEEVYSTKEQNTNDWYTIPTDRLYVTYGGTNYRSSGRRGLCCLRVICSWGRVEIREVKVVAEHCKIESEEAFHSEDKQLLDIWDISKRTTLLCMQDFLEDGVKRDGCIWVSDARVQALCDYALFKQTEIVKKSLFLIAESQTKDGIIYANAIVSGGNQHPSRMAYMFDYVKNSVVDGEPEFYEGCGLLHYVHYSVDFIHMAWEYYEASADKETLCVLWDFLKRDVEYLFSLKDEEIVPKLLPPPPQAVAVRKTVDQGGFLSTYYANFVWALKNYLKIARLLSKEEEMGKIENAIEVYTRKVRGYFANGDILDKDKTGLEMHPVSALSTAFLAGIISKEEYIAVRNAIRGKEAYIVDGYWMYFKLRATFEAGLYEEAMQEMRSYWGTMLDHGATTCWEQFDTEYLYLYEDFIISRCHGWSAGPADLLKRYVENKGK